MSKRRIKASKDPQGTKIVKHPEGRVDVTVNPEPIQAKGQAKNPQEG